MNKPARIESIDIMRGLTLLLMLFVNDLNMNVAPSWMGHTRADYDGMGLADWVFPGFLFMVGMSIPFAITSRLRRGDSHIRVIQHIVIRTLSLLFIGVLMLNSGRVNPETTGLNRNLWALLMYLSVFLIWNDYPRESKKSLYTILRVAGALLLTLLVIIFRAGPTENPGWLVTEWWGILGLIGWGYLVAALVYLFFRDSVAATSIAVILFLIINILDQSGMLGFLNPVRPVLGVIIGGNVPLIVLTGMLGGVLIKRMRADAPERMIILFAILGVASLALGFILRKWFIISKIFATPSWGMICSGISFLLFVVIYWLADVKGHRRWATVVRPAGKHSLTTYLAPDILYYAFWLSGVQVLIYKSSSSPVVAVLGSIAWALLMAGLTALLARFNIKLKL